MRIISFSPESLNADLGIELIKELQLKSNVDYVSNETDEQNIRLKYLISNYADNDCKIQKANGFNPPQIKGRKYKFHR